MNEVITVKNVSVTYRIYKQKFSSLKESFIKMVKKASIQKYENFYALKNINFTVKKGAVIGIIGSNGSGKSTLLKVLTGVLSPSTGSVNIKGNISSLTELGVGFDPELTAEENIYLYGSLYKRSRKEIHERMDYIIDFAELNEFRNTPIKYFSSGMVARLGFSVAVDTNPDVLIVDEVLAVGDERFQKKCNKVFEDFFKSGKTIVIVSHDLHMLEEVCSELFLLSKGEILFHGNAKEALEIYRNDDYGTRLS